MTPDQIHTVHSGLVHVHDLVARYWLDAAVSLGSTSLAWNAYRTAQAIRQRRADRRRADRRRAALDLPDPAPLYLDGLGAHLDDYIAADPELAARFNRLRQAVRDEQQKEAGDA